MDNKYSFSRDRQISMIICNFSIFASMNTDYQIPEPILFNPLKHHLGFIKEFIEMNIDAPGLDLQKLMRQLRHIGTSVMDIYTGSLTVRSICRESVEILRLKKLSEIEKYSLWVGMKADDFHIISIIGWLAMDFQIP